MWDWFACVYFVGRFEFSLWLHANVSLNIRKQINKRHVIDGSNWKMKLSLSTEASSCSFFCPISKFLSSNSLRSGQTDEKTVQFKRIAALFRFWPFSFVLWTRLNRMMNTRSRLKCVHVQSTAFWWMDSLFSFGVFSLVWHSIRLCCLSFIRFPRILFMHSKSRLSFYSALNVVPADECFCVRHLVQRTICSDFMYSSVYTLQFPCLQTIDHMSCFGCCRSSSWPLFVKSIVEVK